MNHHEEYFRTVKATKIANMMLAAHTHLTTDLLCSEIAESMTASEQLRAAAAANVKAPSMATWDRVVELIRDQEAIKSRVGRAVAA